MIDKHDPSRIAAERSFRGVLLCWFHVMKALGEKLQKLGVPWNLRYELCGFHFQFCGFHFQCNHIHSGIHSSPSRYSVAYGFKLIGRARSVEKARNIACDVYVFIRSLGLAPGTADDLVNYIENE